MVMKEILEGPTPGERISDGWESLHLDCITLCVVRYIFKCDQVTFHKDIQSQEHFLAEIIWRKRFSRHHVSPYVSCILPYDPESHPLAFVWDFHCASVPSLSRKHAWMSSEVLSCRPSIWVYFIYKMKQNFIAPCLYFPNSFLYLLFSKYLRRQFIHKIIIIIFNI